MPCYTSTDFEVHRNWLAITHSLPLEQWYQDTTSEWTLDYPPFFAWFEFSLAKVASIFNIDGQEMLRVQNLNHKSFQTVLFQRLTVIITDFVLAIGVKFCCSAINFKQQNELCKFLPALVLTNAGLFIVDHVHFQYNGFLLGIFMMSIGCMMSDCYLSSALLFAILLNFKHIYVYCAPAYFVYLLSTYCRKQNGSLCIFGISLVNLIKLGVIVIGTFALSFGPFLAKGQFLIVLQRLFPFKRGLTHAYWAPNFWAIYNFTDRLAVILVKKMGLEVLLKEGCQNSLGASTGGLVKDTVHCVLPTIPPEVCFIITFALLFPLLWKLWNKGEDSVHFLRAVILCNFISYMFGWHVHEKAILLVTIPMAVLSVVSPTESSHFIVLSAVGNFSLFPLLFEERETVIKVLLVFLHFCLTMHVANQRRKNKNQRPLTLIQKIYLFMHLPVFIISTFIPLMYPSMEFLPLLIYSVFCSIGILCEFVGMYTYFLKVK